MSRQASEPWMVSRQTQQMGTMETNPVHARAASDGQRHGTAVGFVERLFTARSQPTLWQAWAFTDHCRHNQGRVKVGGVEQGRGARERAAATVWAAREIEQVYPESGDGCVLRTSYGCAART